MKNNSESTVAYTTPVFFANLTVGIISFTGYIVTHISSGTNFHFATRELADKFLCGGI